MNIPEVNVVQEKSSIFFDGRKSMSNPGNLKELAKKIYSDWKDDKERVVSILLDTKLKPIGYNLVSVGTMDSSLIHPREVFRPAIVAAAHSIALIHNHPSGDPEPSKEDLMVTMRIEESGKILGIPLIDHIIIGDRTDNFLSLKQEGLM